MPPVIQRTPARHGLTGNQREVARQAAVLFPGPESREPGQGEDDVIFESMYSHLRVQVNSPEITVNLATGTKVKAKNDAILFANGVCMPKGPNKARDIELLMAGKGFSKDPFRGTYWLRAERQKLDVNKAVAQLTEQLRDRPDLIATVQTRLKELSGAGKKFTLPVPPEPSQDQLDAEQAAEEAARVAAGEVIEPSL